MFRALLAHLQVVLHKQQLVYCMRIMSAGCYQGWSVYSNPGTLVAASQQYEHSIPVDVCASPPEDE
jgi:hypothetical protein